MCVCVCVCVCVLHHLRVNSIQRSDLPQRVMSVSASDTITSLTLWCGENQKRGSVSLGVNRVVMFSSTQHSFSSSVSELSVVMVLSQFAGDKNSVPSTHTSTLLLSAVRCVSSPHTLPSGGLSCSAEVSHCLRTEGRERCRGGLGSDVCVCL